IRSLIAQAFAPRIAVFASSDANQLARKLNFPSFFHLIRPFGELIAKPVVIRNSKGLSTTIDNFNVHFVLPPDEHSTSTTDAYSTNSPPDDANNIDTLLRHSLVDSRNELRPSLGSLSNLFLHFFQKTLSAPPLSPHETFSHPTAGIVVITSRTPSPIDTLSSLYRAGSALNNGSLAAAQRASPAIDREYLRFYVLIHHEGDDYDSSAALFEKMKRHFGLNCHFLSLSATDAPSPDQPDATKIPMPSWISPEEEVNFSKSETYMRSRDIAAIQLMVREMVSQSFIPYLERTIATLNTQVAASRKGITNRLFSASRKYFASSGLLRSNTPSPPTSTSSYDPETGSYDYRAQEAQLRKLADLLFMTRDWNASYTIYDLIKRDYLNDKAWKYLAGANEFAAIALLMAEPIGKPLSSRTVTEHIDPVIDAACFSYTSRCAALSYTFRCLLMSSELLRLQGVFGTDNACKWVQYIISKCHNNSVFCPGLMLERLAAAYGSYANAIQACARFGEHKRKFAFWTLIAANEW
ncbi:hypothetical protein CANCADRAFT_14729, partial [Tortispora caseinolytica NRRL Y-17796]